VRNRTQTGQNFFSRHQGTKALRKNNKIKSFVSLCLGGKYFLVPVYQGWDIDKILIDDQPAKDL